MGLNRATINSIKSNDIQAGDIIKSAHTGSEFLVLGFNDNDFASLHCLSYDVLQGFVSHVYHRTSLNHFKVIHKEVQ